MLMYQFSVRKTFLSSLNPLTKFLISLFYVIIVLLAPLDDVPLMVLYVILPILVIAFIGKIWPWEYAGFLFLLLPMVIVLFLLQIFFFAGQPYIYYPLFDNFTLRISQPGVSFGLALGLRILAMALSFSMFVMSTDPFDIGHALHNIGIGFRPSFMVGFALRLVPLVQEELDNIGNAAVARGYPSMYSINPINLMKGLVVSFVPLAVGSLKRGTQMALAMEIRGFSLPGQLGIKRTYMKDIRMRKRDWFCLFAFFVLWIYTFLSYFNLV